MRAPQEHVDRRVKIRDPDPTDPSRLSGPLDAFARERARRVSLALGRDERSAPAAAVKEAVSSDGLY
jgi:hypothetical protein